MPDDAPSNPSSEATLDDLERRLATFENATKRLNRTVGGIADPEPTATPGHTSPPRPATRRLSESGVPRSEEISGLRPAVQLQGPQTGALTARARSGTAGGSLAGTPGFTSAYGKPTIPTAMPGTAVHRPQAAAAQAPRRPAWLLPVGIACACAIVLVLIARVSVREVKDVDLWTDTTVLRTPAAGTVAEVLVKVGDSLLADQAILRITGTVPATVAASRPCTLMRLMATNGSAVGANEPIAEVAAPDSLRVIVGVPSLTSAARGDRASIRLIGEDRTIGGTVESVLAAGAAGPGTSSVAAPARAIIIPDPSPLPPRLGQAARVVLLGRDPGPLTTLLVSLRRATSW